MSFPAELRALAAGRMARRVLRRRARVIARFERSAYVENRRGIACIGAPGIGGGPLNALLGAPVRMPALGATVLVDVSRAIAWKPVAATPVAPERMARSLEILGATKGRGLFPQRHRHPSIVALKDWVAAGGRMRMPQAAAALIGMGPGLTPAGDDLVGGLLVSLRAARRYALAARVASPVLRLASKRTSRISRAHLAGAALGQGGAVLHALVNALLSGKRDLAREIAAIDAVGHTSGWDAAAGAVIALEALSCPLGPRSRRDRRTSRERCPG